MAASPPYMKCCTAGKSNIITKENAIMMQLFYTYNRLYPSMGSVIMDTIQKAETEGARLGYEGRDLIDYVTGEILDVVDP